MEHLPLIWDWTKKIAGITFTVSFVLYLIRCIATWSILSLPQWEKWFNGLMSYIF